MSIGKSIFMNERGMLDIRSLVMGLVKNTPILYQSVKVDVKIDSESIKGKQNISTIGVSLTETNQKVKEVLSEV